MKRVLSFLSILISTTSLVLAAPLVWADNSGDNASTQPNAGEFKDADQFPKAFTQTDGAIDPLRQSSKTQNYADVYPKRMRVDQAGQAASEQQVASNKSTTSQSNQAGEASTETSASTSTDTDKVAATQSRKSSSQGQRQVTGLTASANMIQSSLMSAKDFSNGLRTELESMGDQAPSTASVPSLRKFADEINTDLKVADRNEARLRSRVGKIPQIVQSDNFKSNSTALSELRDFNRAWQAKIGNASYWSDRKTVMSDLDQLNSRIDNAISKNKDLAQNELSSNRTG